MRSKKVPSGRLVALQVKRVQRAAPIKRDSVVDMAQRWCALDDGIDVMRWRHEQKEERWPGDGDYLALKIQTATAEMAALDYMIAVTPARTKTGALVQLRLANEILERHSVPGVTVTPATLQALRRLVHSAGRAIEDVETDRPVFSYKLIGAYPFPGSTANLAFTVDERREQERRWRAECRADRAAARAADQNTTGDEVPS